METGTLKGTSCPSPAETSGQNASDEDGVPFFTIYDEYWDEGNAPDGMQLLGGMAPPPPQGDGPKDIRRRRYFMPTVAQDSLWLAQMDALLPVCPMDRTLNWVLTDWVRPADPNDAALAEMLACNIPPSGRIVLPNPEPSDHIIEGYETSISRCDSERGTHGRSSPPPFDPEGVLLREIYKQLQERQRGVKERIVAGEFTVANPPLPPTNLDIRTLAENAAHATHTILDVGQRSHPAADPVRMRRHYTTGTSVPQPNQNNALRQARSRYASAPESEWTGRQLAPLKTQLIKSPANRMHLRANGRKRFADSRAIGMPTWTCHWRNCLLRLGSSIELYKHIEQEHVYADPLLLSGEQGFPCQWRGCSLAVQGAHRDFKARYQLLFHIQATHCKETMALTDADESFNKSHHFIGKENSHAHDSSSRDPARHKPGIHSLPNIRGDVSRGLRQDIRLNPDVNWLSTNIPPMAARQEYLTTSGPTRLETKRKAKQ